MTNRKRFLIGTPLSTHEALEREARRSGVSVSLYACVILEAHLDALARLQSDIADDESGHEGD